MFKNTPYHAASTACWSMATSQKPDINLLEVVEATCMSPLVAAVATLVHNHKILNKIAKKVGVSTKFGDENLFSNYLSSGDIYWVYVRDHATNQTYEGQVRSWSETNNIQEMVLSDVTVYVYETSEKLYSLPSLYIARPAGTFVIEAIPPTQIQDGEHGKANNQPTA